MKYLKTQDKLNHARNLLNTQPKKAQYILRQISNWHCDQRQRNEKRWLLDIVKWAIKHGNNWEVEFNNFLMKLLETLDNIYLEGLGYGYYADNGEDSDIKTLWLEKGVVKAITDNNETVEVDNDIALQIMGDIYITRERLRTVYGEITEFNYGGDFKELNDNFVIQANCLRDIVNNHKTKNNAQNGGKAA